MLEKRKILKIKNIENSKYRNQNSINVSLTLPETRSKQTVTKT